jgi:hypothetical protein
VQPEQQILFGRAGRQHQHQQVVVVPAQRAAHLQPVEAGHHHVQDEQVRRRLAGPRQRRPAVVHDSHLVSRRPEVLPQDLGLPHVVFGNEHVSTHDGDYRSAGRGDARSAAILTGS